MRIWILFKNRGRHSPELVKAVTSREVASEWVMRGEGRGGKGWIESVELEDVQDRTIRSDNPKME